ncbi:hypothetical protein EDB92DRAFT_1954119 [Lactarius akahatsu]|uniref:Uncharacterized protein n=1 Tax=Lactarius akahatsu TaxID=416441 RepID=A0AAD4Q8B9_9AGAM|nr:hypothetical protein EDB92DRAFT_1954119 [Lactarius akahatsu]
MSTPTSCPLSPTVPTALALPDEHPPSPPVVTSVPLINFLDNNDDTFLDAYPLLSPASQSSRIEVNTTLNGGVKTSNNLVSIRTNGNTAQYPDLFLAHTLERLRDPDEIEPIAPHHHTLTPRPDSPAPRIAIISMKHPLYTHARKRHEREYDADDEEDRKRPAKQLVTHTTPLPSFKKYRRRLTVQKYKPPKQMPSPYLIPSEKPRTMDSAEPPAFDAAKDPEHPLNPFEVDLRSAVHGFHKKYRPIDIPKIDEP